MRVQDWMEASMSTHTAVETLLVRVRDWWRAQNELTNVDPKELGRVVGISDCQTKDLKDLVGALQTEVQHLEVRVLEWERATIICRRLSGQR